MIVITPSELETIRVSYIEASKNTKNLFDNFYSKFFSKDPSVKRLFANVDMQKQKQMLFESITYFINTDEITDEDLDEYVKSLKLKHPFPITHDQMNNFKESFLETIKDVHGDKFSEDINNVWKKFLTEIFTRYTSL